MLIFSLPYAFATPLRHFADFISRRYFRLFHFLFRCHYFITFSLISLFDISIFSLLLMFSLSFRFIFCRHYFFIFRFGFHYAIAIFDTSIISLFSLFLMLATLLLIIDIELLPVSCHYCRFRRRHYTLMPLTPLLLIIFIRH
jgi:hypothetical protein